MGQKGRMRRENTRHIKAQRHRKRNGEDFPAHIMVIIIINIITIGLDGSSSAEELITHASSTVVWKVTYTSTLINQEASRVGCLAAVERYDN